MPPGIENDDYDSEGDTHFLEEFLNNDTLPLLKNKSSNFDHHDDSSFPRPLPKPPDVEYGDEHHSTNPETKSDEVINSSVKNFVPIPSEFEVTSDNESECDVPVNDESFTIFTTFSNPLFDCKNDFTSSDDESHFNEDVWIENLKIYSNPLFDDEENISTKIDPHYFGAESNLIKSLLNRDTLIDSSPKFDYFLEEFSGELAHIDLIPPRIEEADFDLEEEIHLVENLLYLSPRLPEEINAEIADTIVESLSPSLILVEDSSTSDETGKKKGRTVTLTTDDMQKRKNDVKARTTLLLALPDGHQLRSDLDTISLDDLYNHLKRKNDVKARTTLLLALPDGHQLRFNKHKTAQELWAAILKTFSGNEATKKTKKNLLKAPRSQDRGTRDNYIQGSKVEEQTQKALMAIDRVRWDWSYMANDEENHALVADEEAPTEFALMAKTSAESEGSSQNNIDDKGYWDSGCSRHMTGNISYLSDYEPFDEGYVSFGQGGCKITGKGTIKTGKLKFENVYFVKYL
nr:ribonuclease H-like domain-containing protein [Tanacetum cinerariifolium]